jgi:hypothetical protein
MAKVNISYGSAQRGARTEIRIEQWNLICSERFITALNEREGQWGM